MWENLDHYSLFCQEWAEQAAQRRAPKPATIPVSLLASSSSTATSRLFVTFRQKDGQPWGYTRGVEKRVKRVILVFLLRFSPFSAPFWSDPALNQGVTSQGEQRFMPSTFPDWRAEDGNITRFTVGAHPRAIPAWMCKNVQNVLETHRS